MNIHDLSTRKLKRLFLKTVNEYWKIKDNPYRPRRIERKEAWDYLQAIKSELSDRGWYV